MRRVPIYGLDFIRFFAASLVLFYHIGFKFFALASERLHSGLEMASLLPAWSSLADGGWIGVQIFFVISGVVISYSAENASAASFLRGRVARLLPSVLICAAIMTLIALGLHYFPLPETALRLIKTITFFPIGPWLTGQLWTLPIEIAFYAVIWFLIATQNIKRLVNVAYVIGAASSLYWLSQATGLAPDPFPRLTQLLLLQHGCYFCLGVLLARIDLKSTSPVPLFMALVCIMTAYVQIHATASLERGALAIPDITMTVFCVWLEAVLLIEASLHWRLKIDMALKGYGPVIRVIGLVTYPVYLVHMHVAGPILVKALKLHIAPGIGVAAGGLGAIAVSTAITLWLEPPLRKAIEKLMSSGSFAVSQLSLRFKSAT